MQDDIKEIKKLVHILNQASAVYYQGQDEIMSNLEYDRLYGEPDGTGRLRGVERASQRAAPDADAFAG